MFALCLMFGGIVVVSAQDTQDTTSNQYRTETQSQYPQDSLSQSQDMTNQDQSQSQGMMGQQDRERIQVTELPDEVKRSLEGQEYRGWLISGAFKAQSGDQSSMESDTTSTDATQQQESANATGMEEEEVFIVELKNGAETKTVRFDSKGEVVEGMEGDQNGQTPGNQYNQNQDQSTIDPSTQPDQSQSSQSAEPAQSEQSTGTPSGQSTETQSQSEQSTTPESQTETQTEQSKANEPK